MVAQRPHQPPVLPSNAPPYGSGVADDGQDLPSRVLREHSGNRQLGYSHTGSDSLGVKYRAQGVNENGYPNFCGQAYQPQLDRRGSCQDASRYKAEVDAYLAKTAKMLYRRVLDSEGYRNYRDRQVKKGGQDQKWPENLEIAFFQSLVNWPPMGRRKLMWKGELHGRNELIADHINELTSESRTRKQVSSHIQVLKPFVEKDTVIMRYLSTDDLSGGPHGGQYHGGFDSAYGRRKSHHSVTAPLQRSVLPPLQTMGDVQDRRRLRESFDFFEPRNFRMFVQAPDARGEMRRDHYYSKSMRSPRQPDVVIQDWATFGQHYPRLSAMHAQQPLECNVLAAEGALAIPTADVSKNKAEIGIYFMFNSQQISVNAPIQCHTSFYKKGQINPWYSNSKAVGVTKREDGRGIEAQVPFGSKFWAPTLHHLSQRLREETDSSLKGSQRRCEENVQQTISNLTAIQEIVLTSDWDAPERLLVIAWAFRLSRKAKRTCWRKLVLPCDSALITEPNVNVVVDPILDFNGPLLEPVSGDEPSTLPTLQSPFEYDCTSTSALSSATWPTNTSDVQTCFTSIDGLPPGDNSYDFTGGHIDLTYEASLPIDGFDNTAFDFSQPAADYQLGTEYMPTDLALQQYSHQPWDEDCGSYLTAPIYTSQSEYAAPAAQMSHGDAFQSYETSHSYDSYHGGQYERRESGLGALADASCLAQHSSSAVHV